MTDYWLVTITMKPDEDVNIRVAEQVAGRRITWSRSAPRELRQLAWMLSHDEAQYVHDQLALARYNVSMGPFKPKFPPPTKEADDVRSDRPMGEHNGSQSQRVRRSDARRPRPRPADHRPDPAGGSGDSLGEPHTPPRPDPLPDRDHAY